MFGVVTVKTNRQAAVHVTLSDMREGQPLPGAMTAKIPDPYKPLTVVDTDTVPTSESR